MGQAQSQSSGADCGDCSDSGNGDGHYSNGKSNDCKADKRVIKIMQVAQIR